MTDNVTIYAHRSAEGTAPENTLAAYREVLNQGFSLEADVRRSRDGSFVMCHDSDLSRMADVDSEVADLSLETLRDIPIWSNRAGGPYTLPTLSDVLDLFATEADSNAKLALHLKGDEWSGMEAATSVARQVSTFSRRYDSTLLDRMFLFDVTIDAARRIKRQAPELCVGLSVGDPDLFPSREHPTIYPPDNVPDSDCWDVVWADEWLGSLYSAKFVRQWDDKRPIVCVSPELHCSTDPAHPDCDSPEDVWRRLLSLEVDGICTDVPVTLHKEIHDCV